jgi:hypothetical protein
MNRPAALFISTCPHRKPNPAGFRGGIGRSSFLWLIYWCAVIGLFWSKASSITARLSISRLHSGWNDSAANRQAGACRDKVTVWLKYLENQSRHRRDHNDPLATCDFAWLLSEFGIPERRV